MTLGFIGLGKMGLRMVIKLQKEGHEVVVWNRSEHELKTAATIEKLVKSLKSPRIIWSMVPAGEATQNVLDEVSKFVSKGDIVIDGGNSNFKDTEKRFKDFKNKGIRYLGIGVSGGVIAFENGYPLMVGGDKSAYEFIKPILDSLAKPQGGHEYFGTGGAGHFVKMVHNGIEYGIMQSLGEGFEVLQKAEYNFDLVKVAKLWQKGTLVSGFMLDRAKEALENDPKLADIVGIIAESGEAGWTIEQAKEEGVDVEIIERSLEYRRRSQTNPKIQKSFTAKLIAALRNAFGGHPIRLAQSKEVKKK
ncbi:MAG: 6-phosphogluconate dehydrogenase (decarboxylating) [Candidatus Levybacteria bacterium RIFCSPLOWO2_01_FULL_39_24]|nr:MAG: 6-phosphogluconate dehydrogenase (decarboxylating) [Candidatus Levybacteria bacterium RIFCSPHIGHO2_01_FULL_40_16]OGH28216.1 MAG: 6-phosphogluconate dehydrogenase (decarboxylating) [Candidatus Levybacteria bacterium RIFCSPHIGHO2_12_FULL_39_9]OGH46651.1 MAG: 6-phosphogluconate dehydrogenase (decarboxylating) [Candidatus Levybacteria bacterium RIFCSPLOWO2_01_FULL_39_24]